tara:strand:- start:89 stop:949 length:861 start_codon:yes stop_codon:yes gene_type:complete
LYHNPTISVKNCKRCYIFSCNIENAIQKPNEKDKNMTSETKRAALIIIGNEILSGRTLDKNTQHIGQKMGEQGVPLSEVRVVPDIEHKIIETVNTLREEYDYVFTTGGIGPTHDDITASCIAKAFEREFVRNEAAFAILEDYYKDDEFTPARQRMTMMPEGVELIPNPVSGAPGFKIENVYVMAGVPRIMQGMLDHILKTMEHGKTISSKTLLAQLPESKLAEAVGDIQERNTDVELGSYPGYRNGLLWTSIVVRSTDEARLEEVANEVEALIEKLTLQNNTQSKD